METFYQTDGMTMLCSKIPLNTVSDGFIYQNLTSEEINNICLPYYFFLITDTNGKRISSYFSELSVSVYCTIKEYTPFFSVRYLSIVSILNSIWLDNYDQNNGWAFKGR